VPACGPIQINAGTAMGEATIMQGVLPLPVGTGTQIYDPVTKKWQGATRNINEVLDARCATLVRLTPGYEHPADPRQPDATHRH